MIEYLTVHWLASHLAFAKIFAGVAIATKKVLIFVLPTILVLTALYTIDLDPRTKHTLFTYIKLTGRTTTVTVMVAGIWTMLRLIMNLRVKKGTFYAYAPFLLVWVGFLFSSIPSLPSPWTYLAVVTGFWLSLLIVPLRWAYRLFRPRAL